MHHCVLPAGNVVGGVVPGWCQGMAGRLMGLWYGRGKMDGRYVVVCEVVVCGMVCGWCVRVWQGD